MNQAQLFPDAKAIEHGGYHPANCHAYRGRQVPVTYQEQESMHVSRKPTLLWLLDEILDALRSGPILRRDLYDRTGTPVDHGTLGRHLYLLIELDLVRMDYKFDEPRNAGGADPAVVELVEG